MTHDQLEALRKQPAKVPCNGCTACCKHDAVVLRPAERMKYKHHIEQVAGKNYAVLDRKDNGDCTYLMEDGCSIHDDAPDICKRMDCRVLYLITPAEIRGRRVKENPQMAIIYQEAEKRLDTLEIL